jgi:hypothetical protein
MFRTVQRTASRALATGLLVATAIQPAAGSNACSLGRVDVYDRNDRQALETYRHDGRQYVIGTPGHEYAVRVRNCTGRRLLAVVSVDGVNAVTGETASTGQSGYVIEPGGYVNIAGWRKDLERTAAFYFSDPDDAYASRTGRPDDLGVIGVALFRERERPAPYAYENHAPEAASSADATARQGAAERREQSTARAAVMDAPLGTGHGRREYSPVEQVEFERASASPDERIVIRYDRRENLVAMGVLPPARRWHEADPFPATLGFVPDP